MSACKVGVPQVSCFQATWANWVPLRETPFNFMCKYLTIARKGGVIAMPKYLRVNLNGESPLGIPLIQGFPVHFEFKDRT